MRGRPHSRSTYAPRWLVLSAVLGAGAAAVGTAACGTDAVGVEACQRIERVRCESAPACGIDLDRPPHSGSAPPNDVAACIRYYDDQCLHGLVTTEEPGRPAVDACIDAIITGDCEVVRSPESHAACSFLVPPAAPAPAPPLDAAAEADAPPG